VKHLHPEHMEVEVCRFWPVGSCCSDRVCLSLLLRLQEVRPIGKTRYQFNISVREMFNDEQHAANAANPIH
jgi:hypothetical protein